MNFIIPLIALVSAITPARTWYAPSMPLTINVKSEGAVQLMLTDFNGKVLTTQTPTEVTGEKSIDIRTIWPELANAGTFILYAVPKGKPIAQFDGTPLVIELRADRRQGAAAPPEVVRVSPLEYAVMTTEHGPMTMVFYYDVAPVTVASFLNLSRTGYFDKLSFHRIVPGFVIQGGDPKGDGTGGPGYHVEAEFSDRPHLEGVLSMARSQDPDSAGSQFFVCLDYSRTRALDHKYTTFGRVVEGMDAAKKIAATPLAEGSGQDGPPKTPQIIQKVEVKPVTAGENPYADMFHLKEAAAPGK